MADPSSRSSVSSPNQADEEARLDRIRALWDQLARAHEKSRQYRILVQEIKKEADAFRKLLEARRQRD